MTILFECDSRTCIFSTDSTNLVNKFNRKNKLCCLRMQIHKTRKIGGIYCTHSNAQTHFSVCNSMTLSSLVYTKITSTSLGQKLRRNRMLAFVLQNIVYTPKWSVYLCFHATMFPLYLCFLALFITKWKCYPNAMN